MAKKLSYEKIKMPDGSYRVYLGAGKYAQRSTKLAIEAIIREHKLTRQSRGRDLADLPAALVAELAALHQRCVDSGTSVKNAVDHWIPYHRAQQASIPLVDAVDKFLAYNKAQGLSTATQRERSYRLGLWLRSQPDINTTVFDAAQIDALRGFILDESERTTPASARNLWAVVSAFCTWAIHHDLLDVNPCARIAKPEPGERTVSTMTPDEVAALLRICVENYNFEVISYVVLSVFAGLRPHEFVTEQRAGEWVMLDWKAVGTVDLIKEKRLGKLKLARRIPMHQTLAAWIDYIRAREKTLHGPIVNGYAFYQRFRRWKRSHYPASLPAIENDILRHTYGSYRVISLGEIGKVALEMGNSEAIIRQHYLNGEHTVCDADRYWSLTPDLVLANGNSIKLKII